MSRSLAVIDADTPAFASAISCEEYDFVDTAGYHYRRMKDVPPELKDEVKQEWTCTAPAKFAVARTEKFIQGILDDAGCDDYVCLIGGDGNFRYDIPKLIAQPYKGNRSEMHTPFYLEETKNYLRECHPCVSCDGYEADDGCGIIMSEGMEGYDELLLCHIDKDMNMIEGNHMKWARSLQGKIHPAEFYTVGPVDGLQCFYTQLLTGDATDNIPGLYKLTGHKVLKAIKEGVKSCTTEMEMWEYVRDTYHRFGMCNINILIEIGRLLWIQRKENQLWLPPDVR